MAQLWGSAVARTVGSPLPDCSKCRTPGFEDARVEWGCDAPALAAVFATTCAHCDGTGCAASPDCDVCGEPLCEDGRRHWHRCPSQVIASKASAHGAAFFDAYMAFDAHGVLPVPGGWLDQTACFVEAVRCVANERGRWDRVEQEHYERMRKRGDN